MFIGDAASNTYPPRKARSVQPYLSPLNYEDKFNELEDKRQALGMVMEKSKARY